MANLGERIERWIRQQLQTTPSASRFILRLVDSDGKSEPILKRDVPQHFDVKKETEDLTAEIIFASTEIAKAMRGQVHFHLAALVLDQPQDKSKKRTYTLRVVFKFLQMGQAGIEGGPPGHIVESEAPDKRGMVAMLMRHLEQKEQRMMDLVGSLTSGVREENESLRKRVREMEEYQNETRKKTEELMDKSLERQILRDKAQSSEARKDLFMRKVAEDVIPQIAVKVPDILTSLGISAPQGAPQLTVGHMAANKVREVFAAFEPKDRAWILKTLPDDLAADFSWVLSATEASPEQISAIMRQCFLALPESECEKAVERLKEPHRSELYALMKGAS